MNQKERDLQESAYEEIWTRCSYSSRNAAYATKLRLHHVRHLLTGHMLDVGAGDGQLVALKPYADIVSIDLTKASCKKIIRMGKPAIQADVAQLPFSASRFDTVIILEVLEHVSDPMKALLQIRGVLKTGGTLVLSTPNAEISLVERVFILLRRGVWATPQNLRSWDPLHSTRFTISELCQYVIDAGFQIVHLRPWAKLGFALGHYFVDRLGVRLGLPSASGMLAQFDALLPMDAPANSLIVPRAGSTPDI